MTFFSDDPRMVEVSADRIDEVRDAFKSCAGRVEVLADLLANLVEFYDMVQAGGPDEGQTDREFAADLERRIVPSARRALAEPTPRWSR